MHVCTWFAIFGIVCSASMASSDLEFGVPANISAFQLFDFKVGSFHGMLFSNCIKSHVDMNAANGIFMMVHDENGTIHNPTGGTSDALHTEWGMVMRDENDSASPARNFTLATYRMTRVQMSDNCHSFDHDFDLVSVIKLSAKIEVCTGSGGYWSVAARPCISVFGFDLGCTDIRLGSDNVKYCWNLNAGLGKASLCAEVENRCLSFNGEGCYLKWNGYKCQPFDAQATCW
ncbi:hypothetical protein V9T40_006841 [Parthenolecanium corni]|uniref:Secreted protein n=1 Tax=Parthenolecanium corni TaxID=536013 RepID=A0AAN9Y9M7_9HEMI